MGCVWFRARFACPPPFPVPLCGVGVPAGPGCRLCPALLGWVVGVCFLHCFFFALWCQLLGVPVPGLVVPVPPSPFFRAGLLALFFFFRGVCLHVSVSLFPVGRCSWLGVAGFGWVVPLCLFGGPVFGAFWVEGLAASGGVGGRFRRCGLFSRPPPSPLCFFFSGGGGLPVPPSAFPGRAHALARIQSPMTYARTTKAQSTASVCTKICYFSWKNCQKWPFLGQKLSILASDRQLQSPPPILRVLDAKKHAVWTHRLPKHNLQHFYAPKSAIFQQNRRKIAIFLSKSVCFFEPETSS